ncbi:MAG: LysE family translocator [Pseudomonadota bacterium]
MIELDVLFAILVAFVAITIAPGPANLAVATISMSRGRQTGFKFGSGLAVGFAFWGLVAATGLGALQQASAQAMFALKIAGGAYLIWLAIGSFQRAGSANPEPAVIAERNWLVAGLIMNLSNPKAVVAWIAALAAGFGENSTLLQLVSVTSLCVAIGFANYYAHAFLFSLDGCISLYRRFGRWVETAAALVFAATGLAIMRSAFQRAG